MPNIDSAKKRLRQNPKRRLQNKRRKSAVWTFEKKFHKALEAGDKAQMIAAYSKVVSLYDKAAKVGVIHQNKADRKKARLAKNLNAKVSA